MTDQELTALFNRLAQMEEDCPGCGGTGCRYLVHKPGHDCGRWKCRKCGGSGKVKVFSGVVRVRCPCSMYEAIECALCPPYDLPRLKKRSHPEGKPCCACHGLGTVASEKMEDWVKATTEKGITVVFYSDLLSLGYESMGCRLEFPVDFQEGITAEYGYDPSPKAALGLALEKAVKGG